MRSLSRHELLEMEPEVLLATAECHGLDVEGLPANAVVDLLDDFLRDFEQIVSGGAG